MLERNRNNRAFTLTELLITISLVGLIFLAAVVIQQTADKFYQSTSLKSSVQTNAGYAMEKIVRSIRESKKSGFEIPAAGTLKLTKTDNSSVVFGIKDVEGGKKAIYFRSAEGEEILARNVEYLTFNSSPGSNIIEIRLKVEITKGKDKYKTTVPLELYSSATPRNP